jgi:inhibitor of cysteine peptidase
MRRTIGIILIATVAWFAFGCDSTDKNDPPAEPAEATEPTPPTESTPLTLTAEDDGSTQTIAVGDSFLIELAENPTTGHSWSVASMDQDVLSLEDDDFTHDLAERRIGLGGVQRYTFLAKQAGQTDVHLIYTRAWESGLPDDDFTVTVIVEP